MFHPRCFTSLFIGFTCALSSSSSVLIWFWHWICRILRRHLLWNTSTTLSFSLFTFHVSHLYSRPSTGSTTSVLYSLSFAFLKMFFDFQILFNLTMYSSTFESPFFRSLYLPLYKLYKCSSQVSELIYFCYSLSSYHNHFLVLCNNSYHLCLNSHNCCLFHVNPTRLALSSILAVLSWICYLVEDISTTPSAKSRSSNLNVNFHLIPILTMTNQEQKTRHITSLFDACFNVKPLAYFSLVVYSTLEVFTKYFHHSNDVFWDSIFLHDSQHAFAVDRVEHHFKIYEVQIECCLPLVNLLNEVPQYIE